MRFHFTTYARLLLSCGVLTIGNMLPSPAAAAIDLDGWGDCDSGNYHVLPQPEIYEFLRAGFSNVQNLPTSFSDLQVLMDGLLNGFADAEIIPLPPKDRTALVDNLIHHANLLNKSLKILDEAKSKQLLKVRDWNTAADEVTKTEAALLEIIKSLDASLSDATPEDRQKIADFIPQLQQYVQTLAAIRTTLFELQKTLLMDYNSKI